MYESEEFVNMYPLVKNQVVGSAYGKEMICIYSKSKIVLNIHNTSVPLGGNIRLFEIPVTKSLQNRLVQIANILKTKTKFKSSKFPL